MKLFFIFLTFVAISFGRLIASEPKPNVLFIAVDDLRNDLGAYGVPHAQTPHLDALAQTSRVFNRHYVQVPTCGASRCALLRGKYPSVAAQVGNEGIAQTYREWGPQSLPAVFRQNGYKTLALGKITHHPGGLTGKGWAEGPEELPGAWDRAWIPNGPWKTPESIMHGYANGIARIPGKSPPWQSHDGPDEAYPDAWVAAEAIATLQQLKQTSTQNQPWFFGVGFFKPHLPFAAPKKWHDLHARDGLELSPAVAAKPSWPSGWHNSSEFRSNYGHPDRLNPDTDASYARQMRIAYAASISYMDAQIGRVLAALNELGMAENTVVVLWSDHGFLLGEHGIWGKHCLYDNAIRSPLMIRYPNIVKPGVACDATVETVDVFPTLLDLCHLPSVPGLDGHSLMNHLKDPSAASSKPAHSFWTAGQRSIRTERWRLTVLPAKGDVATPFELFDYQTDPQETQNHAASQPAVVEQLLSMLENIPKPTRP